MDTKILIFVLLVGLVIAQDQNGNPEFNVQDEQQEYEGGHTLTDVQITTEHMPEECTQRAGDGHTVSIHYTGKFEDGQIFDTSRAEGREPLKFRLGSHQVIPGMEKGLMGMCLQEKRVFVIPPHMAYGEKGMPPHIPPNAVLKFDVEMLAIEEGGGGEAQQGGGEAGEASNPTLEMLQTLTPILLIVAGGLYLFLKVQERTPEKAYKPKPQPGNYAKRAKKRADKEKGLRPSKRK